MKITIKEIAERAGVSKATVSRVLNNSKPVKEDVKRRVLGVIESTNFKPNAAARSLSLNKSHLIGIILPDLSNPVFSRIIAGMESFIRDKDFSLLITATDFNIEMKIQHIGILKDKGVDGLVLITDHGNEGIVDALSLFKKPTIMIGSDSAIETIPIVKIDNFKASYEATQHLIDLGHEKIAMIRGPLKDPHSGYDRFEGYKAALQNANMWDESLVVEGWYTFDDGYQGMSLLLEQTEKPSALFCACDLMAVGAIKCAVSSGIQVPEQLSVVGFDDVALARMYSPSLSTVRQPFEEQGILAIRRLIEMIEKSPVHPHEQHVLEYQFIERESTRSFHKKRGT